MPKTLTLFTLFFGAAALLGTATTLATQQKPQDPSASQQKVIPKAPPVSETLARQVMLDRVGFSTGEIDGKNGANVQRALAAFQRASGLRAPSEDDISEQVSKAAGEQPPLTTYALTEADVTGPFTDRIPPDLVEQSKLTTLGYASPLEALAEKFHSSPALLLSLNHGTAFMHAGERITVPNVEVVDASDRTVRAGQTGARITVRAATSALTIETVDGQVLFYAPVTVGSEHDPLPVGHWRVTGVQRMPTFRYDPKLFWNANPAHSTATLPSGPNSPVGVVWIDINRPHYGIHGTPEPSRIGHTESHGCVRLTNWDVARVAQWAKPGMPVRFE